ncbi:MAG TPA: pyridoxamine 5'-phosphate oxidase family protein [Panacibacter sp.]|nr:pyridoxamine 5'-phosphate oxidase family protein [Panacibacter sp.]HNP46473.1 pyridoxamine 5'-phosphate oxidase family protein [Panacibacter sp.]
MGTTKNLYKEEAVAKMKELVSSAGICMFATALKERPLSARPMSTEEVDEEGNLWFLSRDSSRKNAQISKDNEVQLFYSNKDKAEFLSVYGKASIIKDKDKAKQLWTPIAKNWFEQGVDDPELTILKVTPHEVYYWDTQHGRMIAMLKMLQGAFSGKGADDGVMGKISL